MADATDYSDNELIQAWLGGDQRAFECLYLRYRKPLYGYLHKMVCQDPAAVDDLFQQLWMRVVKQLGRYREQERFAAWIFRIARNLVIDQYRLRGRRPAALSLDCEENAINPIEESSEPWRGLDRAELGRRLELAVNELPELQREVFLWRQNDLSFKDIADLQACPLNTALARMQYALKYLRKRLNNWEDMEAAGHE